MSNPSADLPVTQRDGIIELAGEIDLSVADELASVIDQAQYSPGLEIDVSRVTFIDSSGLRCLLRAQRRATESGGEVTLIGVGAEIERLLDLTGTTTLFQRR